MNSDPFTEYKQSFEVLKKAKSPEFADIVPSGLKNLNSEFFDMIDESINNAKIFKVDEDIKDLMLATKHSGPLQSEMKLPFSDIFLEVRPFYIKEELIEGIMLHENNNKEIYYSLKRRNSKEINFDTVNISNPQRNDPSKMTLSKQTKSKIESFVKNIITLFNSREVVVTMVERSEKNIQRRIKQGKKPLPPRLIVSVPLYLKEYMNDLKQGQHSKFSHRFWVRGHWRTYKSKHKVWIKPYIKGEGLLIEKKYVLEE